MSKKLYPETDIQNIANAIRNLNGSSDTYTVSEMASAIALPENAYYLKESASANPLSITDGEELKCQSALVTFAPKQSGTGDPSPSNIRPISGWDSVSLIQVVKNLFHTTATSTVKNGITYTVNTDGTIDVSGTPSGSASYMIGTADIRGLRGNIAVSAFAYSSQMCWDSVAVLDSNNTTLYEYTTRDESTVVIDLTQYPTADHLTITVRRYSTNPVSGTLKPQVEIGTTRTAFVPYTTPSTYTATFPSTEYGGEYDFVSGEGQGTYGIRTLKGTESWSYNSNNVCYQVPRGSMPANTRNAISNMFIFDDAIPTENNHAFVGNNNMLVKVSDASEENLESWKTFLSNNNLVIAYELATPTEISLTPADVELNKGTNVVSTDGDTVQVKYWSKSLT